MMLYPLILVLAAATGRGSVISGRQKGNVDPGTASDCSAWDEVDSSSKDWCQLFTSDWGINRADFLSWNPGLTTSCTGFKPGNSYCVEVNFGLPRETTTTTKPTGTTTTTTKPSITATTTTAIKPSGPSPTQNGIHADCTEYYQAVKGDDCTRVSSKYSVSLEQFYAWNPPVGTDCKSLWVGYWYCVKMPGSGSGSGTTKTTTTTKATATTGCVAAPTPTQPQSQCNCRKWHLVQTDEGCWTLQQIYGFKLEDFVKWNPGVGTSCGTMWLGYHVCVQV